MILIYTTGLSLFFCTEREVKAIMFDVVMITLRESLEAILLVSLAAVYLKRAGNTALLRALYGGTATALLASAAFGVSAAEIGGWSTLYAGWLALAAAGMVGWCAWHMARHGANMKAHIEHTLARLQGAGTQAAWWGVFAFALLTVGREGAETATMLAALTNAQAPTAMLWGGALGVALAAAVGGLWLAYGRAVPLGSLYKVTTWFLAAFVLQLLLYASHEFSESGALPWVNNTAWHLATEDLAEGWVAQWLTLGAVLASLVWLWRAKQQAAVLTRSQGSRA
jgi:high-affinity iron transporter